MSIYSLDPTDPRVAPIRAAMSELAILDAIRARVLERRDSLALRAADQGLSAREVAVALDVSEGRAFQILRQQRRRIGAAVEYPAATHRYKAPDGWDYVTFAYDAFGDVEFAGGEEDDE